MLVARPVVVQLTLTAQLWSVRMIDGGVTPPCSCSTAVMVPAKRAGGKGVSNGILFTPILVGRILFVAPMSEGPALSSARSINMNEEKIVFPARRSKSLLEIVELRLWSASREQSPSA